MQHISNNHKALIATAMASMASVGVLAKSADQVDPMGVYRAVQTGPVEHLRSEFIELRDAREHALAHRDFRLVELLEEQMLAIPHELKGMGLAHNLVTTVGKNDLLDKYLAGSSYTAAWYLMLIGATSYTTGPAVGDTSASHGGWTESVVYSNASRPTAAWAAAASGSKALSSGAVFNINGSDTIKGCGLIGNATKSGSTGILLSAGLFSGGDQPVVNGNTFTVNYSLSA